MNDADEIDVESSGFSDESGQIEAHKLEFVFAGVGAISR